MASKTSLRQFQQELAQRLSGARAGPASSARLGIQCGSALWLIDLTEAGEIMPVPALAHVPLTKPWYAGLANVRGNLVSVVDFSGYATGYATPRGPENRLVLAGARLGVNVALLVSRMLGLRNPRDFTPRPPEGDTPPWEGERWTDPSGFQWSELKLAALIAQPDFMNVGV